MDNDEGAPPPVTSTGFVSGNETGYNYSEDDIVHSEGVVDCLLQVGKIFLTSMGNRTIVILVISFL